MVGGRADQVSIMKAYAEDLRIEEFVTFTGTVPSTEIPSYMSSASIVVSPRSGGTNTPLKIYEYMKSGIPIVATDRLTHTQTLDRTTAHLVPATASGIAGGILRLLDDHDYAKKLSNAAMHKADALYSDRAYIDRVSRFYGTVLEGAL
jgi:glycosyltransferase involved in cell wall biosynthesis